MALNGYSWTDLNDKTYYVPYGIDFISPNSGPVNQYIDVYVYGKGFQQINDDQYSTDPKCRFGSPDNNAVVDAQIVCMICFCCLYVYLQLLTGCCADSRLTSNCKLKQNTQQIFHLQQHYHRTTPPLPGPRPPTNSDSSTVPSSSPATPPKSRSAPTPMSSSTPTKAVATSSTPSPSTTAASSKTPSCANSAGSASQKPSTSTRRSSSAEHLLQKMTQTVSTEKKCCYQWPKMVKTSMK